MCRGSSEGVLDKGVCERCSGEEGALKQGGETQRPGQRGGLDGFPISQSFPASIREAFSQVQDCLLQRDLEPEMRYVDLMEKKESNSSHLHVH
jgi:hypothetical protein